MQGTGWYHTGIEALIGDVAVVRARGPFLGEMAAVGGDGSAARLARVVALDGDRVSLQVFAGTRGLSTRDRTRFLGRPMEVTFSGNILGRVFHGDGRPADGGPALAAEPRIVAGGPSVNPVERTLARRMIRTGIPMVDVFNCLVESQKLPIFAAPGEPAHELLATIGLQADTDVVVFGGLGLTFDDAQYFLRSFDDAGVRNRTVSFVNLGGDPVLERLLVPDLALTVAERFAVDAGKRVLVLLTDMTAYADALREVGLALERIPAGRGYTGDLYSQLARRYERACDFRDHGSVTILAVTTVPGGDLTHPVPDNTGYITEGQLYLRNGMIDPFGSLSRLKQHVIGHATREDHGPLATALVRLYADAADAERKRSMAFDLTGRDRRLLRFAERFRAVFMHRSIRRTLEQSLDDGWRLLAECFSPEELPVREALLRKYLPVSAPL